MLGYAEFIDPAALPLPVKSTRNSSSVTFTLTLTGIGSSVIPSSSIQSSALNVPLGSSFSLSLAYFSPSSRSLSMASRTVSNPYLSTSFRTLLAATLIDATWAYMSPRTKSGILEL